MKIRKKITLWISGTALLSTLAFSSIIFWKMMDQPFQLIDKELRQMADSLTDRLESARDPGSSDLGRLPYDPDDYWIMVKDDRGEVLYRSKLTVFTDIPEKPSTYLVEKHIPRSSIWLGQDSKDDVMFRAMVIQGQVNDHPVKIRIAKPIEGLEEALITLAVDIGLSLSLCVLVIFFLSYALAGRILKPISSITNQSREISERSLDTRIPLGKSKDELHDLSVSLNDMFDRIQHSFNRQREFIGNASHELKSPITLLMLAQEEMLMGEELSESAEKSLIKQLETSRRMSHLVKNLLDLSRMEQQDTLQTEHVDLTQMMKRILEDYADVLAEKEICVNNQMIDPCPVSGDPEKLFRLFVNLIDNAIRYNLAGQGKIQIRAERSKTQVGLEIYNSGNKIQDQDLSHLFEQFYRVEKSRSHALGGSGLGLAIAQKIVSLHKGRIVITNAEDGMIKVAVQLPVNT